MAFIDELLALRGRPRPSDTVKHGGEAADAPAPPPPTSPLIPRRPLWGSPNQPGWIAGIAETDHAPPPDTRALHITDRFAGPVDLPAILDRLAEATEISLDFETTSLTPWSPAVRPGKGQAIGGEATVDGGDHVSEGGTKRKRTSVAAYCAKHDCEMNVLPRPRILSLETDTGLICAVDLDQLTTDERIALVRAVIGSGQVWVGQYSSACGACRNASGRSRLRGNRGRRGASPAPSAIRSG